MDGHDDSNESREVPLARCSARCDAGLSSQQRQATKRADARRIGGGNNRLEGALARRGLTPVVFVGGAVVRGFR